MNTCSRHNCFQCLSDKKQWKVNTETLCKYSDEANRLKINNPLTSLVSLHLFISIKEVL